LTDYEGLLRLGIFAGVLVLMMALESLWPRRTRRCDRLLRWPANFTIAMLDTVLLRLLFPAAAVGFAAVMAERGIGLFNQVSAPGLVVIIASMLLLDLTIYVQHVVFHRTPVLWRIHRMHHTDLDVDVTTGARFHPLEIVLSMFIKCGVIAISGAPAVAVLWFEVLLNACSMFNHANLRLPVQLDHIVRKLIVTPDMHRIHHSVRPAETNSNYGFNLSCWDRLFRTYTEAPAAGHEKMQLGLAEWQTTDELRITRMLALPFTEPDQR